MSKKGKITRKYQEGGDVPKYVSPNRNKLKNPVLTDDLSYQISVPDESVRDWHLNYINSPKYKERLMKMGYSNPDKIIKDRTNRLKNTNIVSSDEVNDIGSYYDQMNGANTIYMENPQIRELNTFREDVMAHELGHVNNSSTNIRKDKKGNLFVSPSNTSLNENEEEYIANRNINVGKKILDIFKGSPAKKNNTYSNVLGGIDHDYSPAENKSDIDALRYMLEKEGLYKAGTQDFTPELLEKAKSNKAIQRSFNAGRVFKKFNDQGIIDIMNNIAMNNTKNTPTARYGGTITSPRMGSGNTKYPYKRKLKPGNPPAKAKYGIEIMQEGGPTGRRRRRGNTEEAPQTIQSTPSGYTIPEVEVTAQKPAFLKYQERFEQQFPLSQRVQQYLDPLARATGSSETNYPSRIDRQYNQDRTDYIARALALDRNDDNYNPKEQEIINQSRYKGMSKEDIYRNPQRLPIPGGDVAQNTLYQNDFLTQIPGARQVIQRLAKGQIGQRTIEKGFQEQGDTTPNAGTTDYAKANFDPLAQFLGSDQGVEKSRYAPKNDYLSFLPSYSLKNRLGINPKFREITSQFVGNESLRNNPIFEQGVNASPYSNAPDLGHYKSGAAWDTEKNLPYYFVSDAWDFDPQDYATRYQSGDKGQNPQAAYKQAYLLQKAGNPYKVYDRFYFDPQTGEYIDDTKDPRFQTKKMGGKIKKMAGGGLSREEDYGSKKKPYPSVSKGDFAGGGRSYPIPTKADAIDALRLAGLHGRADVKAKVYAKYPELKKEFGGTVTDEVFAFNKGKAQNIWYPKLKAELGVEVPEGYHLMSDGTVMADDIMLPEAKKGIYIKPENRGKFTATKKRTGKTTEELTHSKNPITRKRAIFAQNAAKWRKGKYGLEIYDDGGLIDPNDPMFAQKIQELLRTNPELAQDIFSPATPSTPPGTSDLTRIDLPGGQYDDPTGGLFRELNSNTVGGESVDNNTNAQQNKPKSNRPKVNFPSINVGDAISMGVQGLDLLATEYIDKPRKRANELRLLRQQLAPVISKPSTGGYDMPVLAKSGIQITSAYTNPVGLPSPTKPKNPFGNVANNFKVDDPNFANVLAEGGEFLELPDGQTSNITGDRHSDYSGGEFMSLPEGAKIYSDSIKVDKTFQKDLTGSSSGKKKTVAQIAKKFNTEHEEGILKDPTADNISKRSANIMKTFKQSQLQQLFDYQESVKDPLYMINKEQSAQDYLGSEDTVVARKGVKVMQEGGKPPKRRKPPIGVLAPEGGPGMYTIVNGQPVLTTGQVPDTDTTQNLPNGTPWWMNIQGIQGGPPPPVNLRGQMAMLQQPTSTPRLTTPDSTPTDPTTPNSTPTPGINTVGTTLDPISGVRAPELQVAVPPITIPVGEPIDPNKLRKPMPDNNKVNPPRPNPKVPWSNTLNGFGEIVPEIAAYIQNETDFPVFTARYQPRYLNPVELNIQASLNRNYAQTAPLLEGSSGNPSIDNARAAQALANLYDANNEVFQQKFNFDTQNRYQTDATNLQIENQANLYNLQRADDYWNKITARQAVKEATRNNIINSAYSKFKKKQLENRSLQLTNQMFDNFKYDPEQGVYFTPSGDQYIFHEPSGNFINIGTSPGDGVETTRTTRNTPKGTTTTVRQKEKKGS